MRLGQLIRPAKVRRAGKGAYPILSMTMHSGLVHQSEKFKKRVASIDTSQYRVVTRSQLVVGFPIDEGVLSFQRLYDEAIVSPAYDVWNVVDDTSIDLRYLERFLRSPNALSFYKSKLRGTTARRRTLPDDIFLSLAIPLPSLPEQTRIADMLDQADELRRTRRAALRELDHLSRSVFVDMFGDPATNPKGWPLLPIGEIGRVVTGNTPSRAVPEYFGDDIEWIKSDNINTPGDFVTHAIEGLSASGLAVSRVAPPSSILVTCIAGSPDCIGNAALTDRPVAFNQQINALIPEQGESDFLYYQFVVGKRLIQRASTSSMKGMVSKSRFEAVRFMFPPIDLQREYASRVAAIRSLKRSFIDSLAQFEDLFASLQHRAFRGEL